MGESYVAIADQAALQNGVPVNVFEQLIQSESSFSPTPGPNGSPYAFGNPSYGGGIAQFIPSTAQSLGVNRLDPTASLYAAAQYLASLFARFGSWTQAVLAYKGASSPTNQQLFGASGTALLSPGLQQALQSPSNTSTLPGGTTTAAGPVPATTTTGSTPTGTTTGTTAGSQTSPDTSASTNTSGCTGWLSTPVACITATLTELGLILLALIVLGVGLFMLKEEH